MPSTEAQKRAIKAWRERNRQLHSIQTAVYVKAYRLRWKEFNDETKRLGQIIP